MSVNICVAVLRMDLSFVEETWLHRIANFMRLVAGLAYVLRESNEMPRHFKFLRWYVSKLPRVHELCFGCVAIYV